jgi:hypothetical protein
MSWGLVFLKSVVGDNNDFLNFQGAGCENTPCFFKHSLTAFAHSSWCVTFKYLVYSHFFDFSTRMSSLIKRHFPCSFILPRIFTWKCGSNRCVFALLSVCDREDEMLQIHIEMLFGDWRERSANYSFWVSASHEAGEFSSEDPFLFTY